MHMAPITSRHRKADRPAPIGPLALTVAVAILIAAINPVGYIGGGSDDWQYLEAARCVAREGFCVPANHWAARLPLVLPTAAAVALLGETREAIMLVPLAYGLAGLALFAALVQRAAGPTAAALAGAALATAPMAGGEVTALNIGSVEFFFAIAAGWAFQTALRNRSAGWATLAGAALGLAVLSRATALAFLPIAGLAATLLRPADRSLIAPAALGFAAVLLAEAVLYVALVGDPLHAWRLSLGHTNLPTSENPAAHLARSPLFNPLVIAGWERPMGIHVHWTLDGALNLLADPHIAPTLWAALVLLFLARGERAALRVPLLLLGAACLYFGALTFALGVDPKPRMFVPVAAAASATFGLLGARAWRDGGRPLVLLMLGLLALNAAALAYNKLDLRALESTGGRWVTRGTAVDETARRVLTLEPDIRHLPVQPAPAATRLLTVSTGSCTAAEEWHLVRARSFGMTDPPALAALRVRGIALGPVAPLRLCLFRRDRVEVPRP